MENFWLWKAVQVLPLWKDHQHQQQQVRNHFHKIIILPLRNCTVKIVLIFWVVVSKIVLFHSYLGKIPILTHIFQRGWNHQLVLIVETMQVLIACSQNSHPSGSWLGSCSAAFWHARTSGIPQRVPPTFQTGGCRGFYGMYPPENCPISSYNRRHFWVDDERGFRVWWDMDDPFARG